MTTDNVLTVLKKLAYKNGFTRYETREIRYLIDEWEHLNNRPNIRLQRELNERVKTFIDNYSTLTLHYYQSWDFLNEKIVKQFSAQN